MKLGDLEAELIMKRASFFAANMEGMPYERRKQIEMEIESINIKLDNIHRIINVQWDNNNNADSSAILNIPK